MARPKGIEAERHGMTGTRPYRIWRKMRERCGNPRHSFFKDYGQRGITVCPEWRSSFETFWRDMGPSYYEGATLDRIDVNGNYSRENCRWATRAEQMHNRRDNVFLTLDGVRKPIREWSRQLGMDRRTIVSRMSRGWSDHATLTKPVQKKGQAKQKRYVMATTEVHAA